MVAYICETQNVYASRSRYAQGRTPLYIITGEIPNIFEYLSIGIYNWVTFWCNAVVVTPELGRLLGVSHWFGPLIYYWILTPAGQVVSCTTVQWLINLEQNIESWKSCMEAYNEEIETRFDVKDSNVDVDGRMIHGEKLLILDKEDEEFISKCTCVIEDEYLNHTDEVLCYDDK